MEQRMSQGMQRRARKVQPFALVALLLAGLLTVLFMVSETGRAGAAPRLQEEKTATVAADTACPCGQDTYEPDNDLPQAKRLSVGDWQQRSFHQALDVDWVRFDNVKAGRTYVVYTYDLKGDADTYLILHDQMGNPLASNDDIRVGQCPGERSSCASAIRWKPQYTGAYYVSARTMSFSSCGCPGYKIRLTDFGSWLPLALLEPTNTPTNTPTHTPTPTDTPSPTPTFTHTPSPTLTPSLTPTPSQTLTPSQTPSPSLTPTQTLTPSPTPTVTPGPSPTPTMTSSAPQMDYPQAVAVNSASQVIYAASRDNDRVYMISATTLAITGSAVVPDQPWGIAYFAPGNKVYVASWSTGTVTVLDGTSLAVLKTIPVGANPTWVERTGSRIQLVSYGADSVVTIDPASDTVYRNVYLGHSTGAWALAYNANADLTYVSSRDSKTLTVIDGFGNERTVINSGRSASCEPYELDFNPGLNRLYVVCDVEGQQNDLVVVYQANGLELAPVAEMPVGSAGPDQPQGEDGRGGLAVNPGSGSVFVSNSYDNTVTVIDGAANRVTGAATVGKGPFGLAVDPATDRVYVANRLSDDISVFVDPQ